MAARRSASGLAAGGGEGMQSGGVRGGRAHGPGKANGSKRGRGQRESGLVAEEENGGGFSGGLRGGLLQDGEYVATAGRESAGVQRGGFR